MLDQPGAEFWDPEADQACFAAIKAHLNQAIPLHELDHNINDPEFADFCADLLIEILA